MSQPSLQNNNENNRLPRIIMVVFGVLIGVGFLVLTVQFFISKSNKDKNIDSATTAARENNPKAEVRDLKKAGGFALATVSDPTAKSQAKAGNTTVFKVNKDGSMTQIAEGSYFSPLDLLKLGIPLATQAKLTETDVSQVKQSLERVCNYGGTNVPGYVGFDGSFKPDGWQIDASTLDGLEKVLTNVISDKNTQAKPSEKIICVNATRKNSNLTVDKKTYVSTFTLELQFITSNGKITTHKFTFSIGPGDRSYTLDGQKI